MNSLCPGPVNSNIAREAPAFLKILLVPVMKLLFASPEKAAKPVIYLCCAEEMGQRSGRVFPPDAGETGFAAGKG